MLRQLQPDLWQYVLGYLSEIDLCSVALVNHEFYGWAAADCFWEYHCYRQFSKEKQMTAGQKELLFSPTINSNNNGDNNDNNNNISSILYYTLPVTSLPTLSWKQRYGWTICDSQRQHITRDEICYYAWKLTYNGRASKLGLRTFLPDGTYHSPYAGRCEWILDENNNCFSFMGITLNIKRDVTTWGWIIGHETSTVYKSIVDSVAQRRLHHHNHMLPTRLLPPTPTATTTEEEEVEDN